MLVPTRELVEEANLVLVDKLKPMVSGTVLAPLASVVASRVQVGDVFCGPTHFQPGESSDQELTIPGANIEENVATG